MTWASIDAVFKVSLFGGECAEDYLAAIRLGAASDYNVTPIPAPLRGIQIGVTNLANDFRG